MKQLILTYYLFQKKEPAKKVKGEKDDIRTKKVKVLLTHQHKNHVDSNYVVK